MILMRAGVWEFPAVEAQLPMLSRDVFAAVVFIVFSVSAYFQGCDVGG